MLKKTFLHRWEGENFKIQLGQQAHSLPSFGDKVGLCGLAMCVPAFVFQLSKL